MFEKYDIDKLYIGEIEGWIPWSIENIGGNISITGDDVGVYQTIIYEDNGRYIDIYHLDRIICDISKGNINHLCCSIDCCLYILNGSTLRKYSDCLHDKKKNNKTLQRLPFKKNRLLKKQK